VLGSQLEIGAPIPNPTADHAAAPPGNQVKFSASVTPTIISGSGCAVPTYIALVNATWTTSDPKDISINSAQNAATNGLAACLGPTNGSATITASYPNSSGVGPSTLTATATLTCK
jgi:hypothetical protein